MTLRFYNFTSPASRAANRRRAPQQHDNADTSWDAQLSSIIVRTLDGKIEYINRAAQRKYGWPTNQAVGSISHELFSTVFPCPLEEINRKLFESGVWEGQLIHRLSDGRRVKVFSRWELETEGPVTTRVVETNNEFESVSPASAHLKNKDVAAIRFVRFLLAKKMWWIVPAILTLAVLRLLTELGAEHAATPLFH